MAGNSRNFETRIEHLEARAIPWTPPTLTNAMVAAAYERDGYINLEIARGVFVQVQLIEHDADL